jgi:hypothetical protein
MVGEDVGADVAIKHTSVSGYIVPNIAHPGM